MQKKRVSVQIEGRSYALITSDSEKYVQSVVDEVIKRIRKVAQSSKHLDTRDCAILVAMDLCDDRNKSEKKNKEVVAKADKIIKQANELNKNCGEYKDKLTDAINENTALTRRVKALKKENEKLVRELETLKNSNYASARIPVGTPVKTEKTVEKTEEEKKNEKLLGYKPMRQYSLFEDNNEEN